MAGRCQGEKPEGEESCGNAGAVESMESQRQASHSFHEPLGNLAKGRRDSHIPTAPAVGYLSQSEQPRNREVWAMEKWKSKTRIPTFPLPRQACGSKEGNVY